MHVLHFAEHLRRTPSLVTKVKYCGSSDGQKDVACWSFLPKSCPFSKTAPGSPCNLGGGPVEGIAAGAVGPTLAKANADAADKALADAKTKVADAKLAAAAAAKAVADKAVPASTGNATSNATVVVVADPALTKAKADADKEVTDAEAEEAAAKIAATETAAKAKADTDAAAALGAGKAAADAAKIEALANAEAKVLTAGIAKKAADDKVTTAKATADAADKTKIAADKAVANAAATASTAPAPSPAGTNASTAASSPSPSSVRRRLDTAADAAAATDAAEKAGIALANAKTAATTAQANFDVATSSAVAAKVAVDSITATRRNDASAAAKACGMMNAMGSKLSAAFHADAHACRSAVVGYCSSADGKMDPACWSLTPRKCPFMKEEGSAADAKATNLAAKGVADTALVKAKEVKTAADAAFNKAKKAAADAVAVPTTAAPSPSPIAPTANTTAAVSNTTRRRLDAVLDHRANVASAAADVAAAAVVKATSVAAAAAAKVAAGATGSPVVKSPCKSIACGLGTVKSAECRAAVVQWCTSTTGKGDPACWAILSKTTKCPFAAGAKSPCAASACLGVSGTKTVECRATVANYCHSNSRDTACMRILGGKSGSSTCPFSMPSANSMDAGQMSPCVAPECGGGLKTSKACRAVVIMHCAGVAGVADPACRGGFFRSSTFGAPTFMKPTPSVRFFKQDGDDKLSHNGFELDVMTTDAATGGQWAVYENDHRPDAAYVVRDTQNAAADAEIAVADATLFAVQKGAAAAVALAAYTKAVADGATDAETTVLATSTAAAKAEADAKVWLAAANTAKTAAGTAVATAKANAPKAFGTGAYMTGSLAAFQAGSVASRSLTRVEDCTFMPTKTYWVFVQMYHRPQGINGASYSRTSNPVRVRSPHDLSSLAPVFDKVTNTPVIVPAGWTATDKIVGPVFDVDYDLREDALAQGVALRFSGKNDKRTYAKYPYGVRRRQLRLVDDKVVVWDGRGVVRRTHSNNASAGAVDDYRPDAQWGASLRERAAHAPFFGVASGFGTCGTHTYKFTGPVMQSDLYTVDVAYKDLHEHLETKVTSYEFTVDTTYPILTAEGGASRSQLTPSLASVAFTVSETGWVYWKMSAATATAPTNQELAVDKATLLGGTLTTVTGRQAVQGRATFAVEGSADFDVDHVLYAVPVDIAGNIGQVVAVPVPKRVGGGLASSLPQITKIAIHTVTKVGASFNVRVEKRRAVAAIYWHAVPLSTQAPLPMPYVFPIFFNRFES